MPDGPAVKLHPAVVSEDEYQLAKAGLAERLGRDRKGRAVVARQSKHINCFKRLLRHGLDGEGLLLHNKGGGGRNGVQLVLETHAGDSGRADHILSFPYLTFEAAVLSALRGIKPEDVMPKGAGAAPGKVAVLKAKLTNVLGDVASLQDDLKGGYSKAVAAVLRAKEDEAGEVADRLQEELAKESRPVGRAVEELPGLIELVEKEGDAARLRLRPVLRSIVDSVWVVITGRGKERWLSAQVWFTNGCLCRVIIRHRQPMSNGKGEPKDGRWDCRSTPHVWSDDGLNVPDLRTPEGAAKELAWLESWKPTDSDWTCGGTIPAK
jgi:hypothetical protein